MDDGDIFIEGEGGAFTGLAEKLYATEDELQSLLEGNAALLGGRQMDPEAPVRFVLVKRESGVPDGIQTGDRWSIDFTFLDQRAVPTLVEVKRSSDTRIRREVVGQMFDYAANAVAYWPASRLRSDFEATCGERSVDPVPEIASLIGLEDVADPDDVEVEVEDFWQRVSANLQAGRLRLLFVADAIPDELRRIIEFLNKQMTQTEVLGVEVRSYMADGIRVVAPTVVGRTSAAGRAKSIPSTESVNIDALFDQAPVEVHTTKALLDRWAESSTLEVWDGGKSRRYALQGSKHALVDLWPGPKWEAASFDLTAIGSEEARVDLQGVLSRICGEGVTAKNPSMPCSTIVERWDELVTEFLGPYLEACRGS